METPYSFESITFDIQKKFKSVMYTLIVGLAMLTGVVQSYAQTAGTITTDDHSKRIQILDVTPAVAKLMVKSGVDVRCGATHDHNNDGDLLQLDLLPDELKTLDRLGIPYKVIIDKLEDHYEAIAVRDLPIAKAQLAQKKAMQANIAKSSFNNVTQDNFLQYTEANEVDWAVPANFNLGASFGGCLTISEVLDELDDMNSLYPGLVSARQDASPSGETTYGNNSSGTANDWAGQTVNYVRMTSDQGSAEGSKPAMLFTSMIHSREVSALMSNIYFMWYLLENYGTDNRVTELLDNNEIYFIPVVNPDGLLWNETIRPGGGGMQRKNLRPDTGNSTVSTSNTNRGVDLNRNFDYFWGSAGSGSSGSGTSDSYRGPSAFSEPETRILRDFIMWDGTTDVTFPWSGSPVRDFKIVLMNHTTSNVIPLPYGGNPSFVSGREDEFHTWHTDMTKYNRFLFGATIFPPANGIADDWMVGGAADTNGSTGSGLNLLGTTPEIGGIGFWPGPTNILPEAQSVTRQYMISIYYGGKYAKFHDLTQSDITSLSPTLTFGIERVGQTASDFDLVITPGTNMDASGGDITLAANGLGIAGAAAWTNVSTAVTLDSNIQPNDKFTYTISLRNDDGTVIYEVEMEKVYQPTVILSDNPDTDSLTNWTASGSWNNSTADGYTGTRSLRSSTTIPYSNSSSGTLTSDPFDISAAGETVIQFYTQYDIERNFDYVEILGSTDGTNYFPLVGKYNKPETTSSTNGHNLKGGTDEAHQSGSSGRVYDGDTFDEWVMEEIVVDLQNNSFLFGSNSVQIRFRYSNDSNNRGENFSYNFDGFFIDDFKVIQTGNEVECDFDVINTFPYTENWESGRGFFSEAQGDDGNWILNTGTTPTGATGPDQGNGPGGQYLYIESSDIGVTPGAIGFNARAIIQSSCIDLSGQYNASLSFDYHMYGADLGSLAVEVSDDGGLTWNQEFIQEGQDQTDNTDPWTTQVVPLIGYEGDVIRIRFNGLTGDSFFSDIAIDNVVVNATAVCSVTTTYSGGSWNNGTPTLNVQAILSSDYDMTSLPSIDACSLVVTNGTTLTIADGKYLNVDGDIDIAAGGAIVVQNEGSVVQIDESSQAVNAGSITVSKTTPALGLREFSVMSSPVTGSTRDVAFSGAFRVFGHNTALFDTNDAVNALVGDAINFVDQTGNDRIPMTGSEPLDVARGYLVVPNGPGAPSTYTTNYTQGTFNNGTINKSLIYNGSAAESANLIGNPYPSAINAIDFLAANSHIPEVFFWNQNTLPATGGPGYLSYSMEDISYYNSSGGNAAGSSPGVIPTEFIASGQGFGVKPTSNANAVFTNDMRETGNNIAFKSAPVAGSNDRPNKIWLQLNNATYTESSSTTLVAFLKEATNAIDIGYDTKRVGTYTSLFSNAEGLELGIQGRAAFTDDALVPMGFSTLLEETTAYTISIAQLEGANLGEVTIYLKDLETGVITNLSERNYIFTASQGHYPERFELFFKNRTLGSEELEFNENTILLYPNPASGVFTIQNTSNEPIQTLTVYDLQGRQVLSKNLDGANTTDIFVGQLPQGVYMVQINTLNKQIVKRLIKN